MAPIPISSPGRRTYCTARRDQDGDEWDDRLGESCSHRGKHAAYRPFTEVQLAPEPLDSVDEKLATGKDDAEGDYE